MRKFVSVANAVLIGVGLYLVASLESPLSVVIGLASILIGLVDSGLTKKS